MVKPVANLSINSSFYGFVIDKPIII